MDGRSGPGTWDIAINRLHPQYENDGDDDDDAQSGAPFCGRKYDAAETWREMCEVELGLYSYTGHKTTSRGSYRSRNPQISVFSAGRGVTILEILLATVPALEVPVDVWLQLREPRFRLVVRELVSDGLQLLGFLYPGSMVMGVERG